MNDRQGTPRPFQIGPDAIDAALSHVEGLEPEQEDAAFDAFAERQPHLVEFVTAMSEDLGDDALDLALDLLMRVDAIFAQAHGRPVPTVSEDALRRGYERVVTEIAGEIEAAAPDGPIVVEPHVMDFVTEFLFEPLADVDGNELELADEDRAELVITFRTVVEVLAAP